MAKVMAKTVKLADIAAIVNVSTVTVSKALSDQKGVSEEMRARIKQLAKEMGYQTPTAARLSSNKRTYNIGVLISEIYFDQTQSFYWQMYQSDRRKHRRAELLGHTPLLRRENRIVSHQASVSMRLQEMTVTFSATGSPSLPSSSMLLQRQWL